MAFCPNCGFQLTGEDKFCPNCGNSVDTKQEQETTVLVEPAYTAPTYVAPEAPTYTAAPTYATPTQSIPTTPVYTAPTAQAYQPQYQSYQTVVAEPVVETKTKVQGFVGMGLAIGGLVMAVIGLLYTFASMGITGMSFGMAIGFGMFAMPLSIVGRSLCGKSEDAGFRSGACAAGTKVGLAGIIVTIVMTVFGFITLMV